MHQSDPSTDAEIRVEEANKRNAERLQLRYTPEYVEQRVAYLKKRVMARSTVC